MLLRTEHKEILIVGNTLDVIEILVLIDNGLESLDPFRMILKTPLIEEEIGIILPTKTEIPTEDIEIETIPTGFAAPNIRLDLILRKTGASRIEDTLSDDVSFSIVGSVGIIGEEAHQISPPTFGSSEISRSIETSAACTSSIFLLKTSISA